MSNYVWTVRDNKHEYCPMCAKIRPTYGERKGNEIAVGCCYCPRIIRWEDVKDDSGLAEGLRQDGV